MSPRQHNERDETMKATPTKLKSGDWGATVKSTDVSVGDTITVTTRAGKTWDATVAKVVWTGNGVAIVATDSKSTKARSGYVPAARNSRGYCVYMQSWPWRGCSRMCLIGD